MRNCLVIVMGLLLTLGALGVYRLTDFTLPTDAQQHTLQVDYQQSRLEGTLIVPHGVVSPPVVLLVHGDGAQDRWSDGGYLPLVRYLVSQGIAVFSWDKPGVGASQGNWLAQTMDDRAHEAAFMLQQLKQMPELAASRVGFLGFSQAGWVVPDASAFAKADFAILVGAAINWRDQGSYYLRQRLSREGMSEQNIREAVARDSVDFATQFTPQAALRPCKVSCNRDDFERRNAFADARGAIARMHTPVMIMMGKDDRNVDPQETLTVWAADLPANTVRCIKPVAGATHGLLRSRWFDYQLPSQWPLWKQGVFLLSGQYAWAPGALSGITDWIHTGTCTQ